MCVMIGTTLNRLLGRRGGSGRGNLDRGNPSPTVHLTSGGDNGSSHQPPYISTFQKILGDRNIH